MYNYSIIIPHKNIPQLLERCLASIPQRDDVQVIVVDDSSDPKIVDFAHFPGQGRPNTEVVFHKSPIGGVGGGGYARNCGMDIARGKWLVFADADDFFHPAIADAFDRYADVEDTDMVFFRHDSIDNDTLGPVAINTKRNKMLAEFDRTGDDDNIRYRLGVAWGRFIRRDMVAGHHIRFDEVRFSNYTMFSLQAGYFAAKIVSDPAVVYCNVSREGSLVHEGRRDWAAMEQRFDVDYRASLFAASVGKGALLEKVTADRWRELSQINRRKALRLLPRLREVCSPAQVRRVRFEEIMRRWFGVGKS
jgi:glycosyltransferase involved in cell wall biosynthesis